MYFTKFFTVCQVPFSLLGEGSADMCGEPLNHFLALFAATDFRLTAVLCALFFRPAKGIYELFELSNRHKVSGEVLGDICHLVAVGVALVHVPNAVHRGLALAHIARHKGESRRLDADMTLAEHDIRAVAIVRAVVFCALRADICAHAPLAVVARVAGYSHRIEDSTCHFLLPPCNFLNSFARGFPRPL